ncbi:MAG: flagellar basal body P-ring formation chaperone FlgA [Candidatus Margulisiibacteriota bacterium]|nr:flagellar basal body P-ring formation chaperone FlgA [Candidatus Margulisiibacteriota bacterium]
MTASFALENPEREMTEVIENYVLEKYPEWIGLEIKVNYKYADKTFNKLRSMGDKVTLEIPEQYQNSRPVGNVILPVVVSSKGYSKKLFVRAKVEVLHDVAVANNYIQRGSVITDEDVMIEQRDIAMVPQKFHFKLEDVVGKEAKTSIPEKSTVYAWMIKEVPQVHRGDKVMISIVGTNLMVKSEGTALEDGYIGKILKVKRKNVKNPLEGILVSANEVEVVLK